MTEVSYEQKYKQTVISFFDKRTNYDNSITVQRALPLLETVELQPGHKVLDVATGTGIIAIAAAKAVGPTGSVIGIDFSEGMLQQAQAKSNEQQINNTEWIQADADTITFAAETFDAIFCSSALVYLRDIPKIFQDWYQWLKPGGTAAFSAWSETSYPAPWIIETCRRHNVTIENINAPTGTPEKCRQLMQTAGFQDIDIFERALGAYKLAEKVSKWDGSWFHPKANPLDSLSEENIQLITSNYRQYVQAQATEKGVWCESTAYFVSGKK